MTSREFKRWLKGKGCTFDENRGKGGHVLVYFGGKCATLPMHGSRQELRKGTVEGVKKQLGLSETGKKDIGKKE